MNDGDVDQYLTDRLEASVSGIDARSRLGEILTSASAGPSRSPRRWIAVAAAVTLLVIAGTALVVRHGDRADEVRTATTVTTSSTTTPPPAVEEARLGQRLTVAASSLPAGMRFIDEHADDIGFDESLIARFALDDGSWGGDGPYLRVISHRDPGIADTYQPGSQGTTVTVQGHAGTLWVDPDTDPAIVDPPGNLANLQNPWVTLDWAPGNDQVLLVQAKGIANEDLLEIAETVRYEQAPDPDTLSLYELVRATYGTEMCCTNIASDQVTFTLPRHPPATLARSPIKEARPEDPRTGLAFHRYDMVEADGAVVRGYLDSTTVAVRFDCRGDRYQLTTQSTHAGLADPGGLLTSFAPRLADAAGCPRTAVSSPTECLGLADDPAACAETDIGD